MLSEIGFAVVNENPEGLYTTLRDTEDLYGLGNIRNRTIKIADLYPNKGLFARCAMRVQAIDIRGVRCWDGHITVDYRRPNDEYWTKEEREQLARLTTAGAQVIDPGMEPAIWIDKAGKSELRVEDPSFFLSFGLAPFYDDEGAKWIDQVRINDEALRDKHLFLPPDLREGIEQTLFKLSHSTHPLPGTSELTIQLSGLDEQRRRCFLQLTPETFFDRIRIWGSFVEMAIMAVSEVKRQSQTGVLILRAP